MDNSSNSGKKKKTEQDVESLTLSTDSDKSEWNKTFPLREKRSMRMSEQEGPSRINQPSNTTVDISPSIFTLDRELQNYNLNKRESPSFINYPGTETEVYDYVAERTDMHNTNIAESTAHLIKGSLGAGVLSMHEAFMYGGLWLSLVSTIFIGFLISYTMYMLARSAQRMYGRIRMSKLSYPDLAEVAAATGPFKCLKRHSKLFRHTIDMCLFLEMCGTCCIYQIMIAHTLKQVLEGMNTQFVDSLMDLRLCILLATPFLLLLCMIRSLKFLAPFSMLADIFIATCVLTTLYYSLRSVDDIQERYGVKDFQGFTKFIGLCLYCTCGIAVVLPVENNMRKPRYFRVALQYAMTIVIILTCVTGFFGYWGWGEECRSPITVHMPLNTFTMILQFLLVMMLSTTFAVQFWVPFRLVWHYMKRKYKRKQAMWERFYRLVMGILVTSMSLAFPSLIPMLIFFGQFFLGWLGFIFPALIEMLVCWRDKRTIKTRWKFMKDIFLMIIGLFLSLSSFYSVRQP